MAGLTVPSWFDVRAAILGALLMSSIVALVNSPHGASAMATSGAKQFVYTFFFAGLIMRFCTWLAERPGPRARIVATAIVVPSLITVVLIYFVHSLRGTPSPIASTAAVATIAIPSFTMWSFRTRRERDEALGAAAGTL